MVTSPSFAPHWYNFTTATLLVVIAGHGETPTKLLQGWKKLISIINFFLFGWGQLV